MRPLLIALLCAALSIAGAPALWAAGNLSLYASEDQAQQHCPHDVIVWLNLQTLTYSWKGLRDYGRGQHGAYACKSEADGVGARGPLKGQ